MTARRWSTRLALCAGIASAGCGGGAGLMHPAHTLPPDRVTMGAGVSSQFVLGKAEEQIQAARAATATGAPTTSAEEQDFIEGAVAHTLLAPGLAPWVGARAGVGYESDVGLTYTGRAVRLDGRHALEGKSFAASAGLGATGILAHPGHDSPGDARGGKDENIPGLDTGGVAGFGVDLPILVGWRSEPALFQIWAGARGGYERLTGDVLLRIDPDPTVQEEDPFEASRWYALGVLGVMAAIDPVAVALELDAGYARGKGSIQRTDPTGGRVRLNGKVEGFTVTPTAAVLGRF